MKTRKQKETNEKEIHLLEQKGYERMMNEIMPVQQAEVYRKPTKKVVEEAVKEFALHLAVTHQIAGCGQGCQAGTDDICGFMINALRLFGTCKCFVVATGIVHGKASLLRFFLSYNSSMLFSMATVYPALARRTTNKLCPMYKI